MRLRWFLLAALVAFLLVAWTTPAAPRGDRDSVALPPGATAHGLRGASPGGLSFGRPTRAPTRTGDAPQTMIGTVLIAGDANYANPSHGSRYLAIRADRGTRVRICGAGGCERMVSTDYGPAKRTGDIADIALDVFTDVCGYRRAPRNDTEDSTWFARLMGECRVTIEYLDTANPTLPPTDTAP